MLTDTQITKGCTKGYINEDEESSSSDDDHNVTPQQILISTNNNNKNENVRAEGKLSIGWLWMDYIGFKKMW